MAGEPNDFFELFEGPVTPGEPHDAWEEIRRRHASDRTVPARLIEREPRGWVAEVLGVRAILLDDAVDPELASGLAVERTIDAWVLAYDLDRAELRLYFVDKTR